MSRPWLVAAGEQPRVLITGCASGIGRALASEMTARGAYVIATDRTLEGLAGLDVAERLRLDLTDARSMADALAQAGRVDILVNNAGLGVRGPVEQVPMTSVRELFEVMFFGPLTLIQGVVPGMRERGRGLVVNVSSGMAGSVVRPLFAFYSAAKVALEGMSEGLSYEVGRFGVRVLVLQPGNVATGFRPALRREGQAGAYADLAEGIERWRQAAQRTELSMSAQEFARRAADAIATDDGRLRVPIGADAEAALAGRRALTDEAFRDVVLAEFVPPRDHLSRRYTIVSLVLPRDLVGYARDRPAAAWPGGARLAVSLVLNYEEGAELSLADGDLVSEGVPGVPVPVTAVRDVRNESLFEFGSRVGAWRLLELFDAHRVPVTVFACGRALERNQDVAHALSAAGHEVAGHGYRWVRYRSLSRAEQLDDIRRAVAAIEATTGQRPRGYFARDYGADIRELLVEVGGFVYDSHAFNDEVPYTVDVSGSRLVVVPYAADTNDLGMDLRPMFPYAGGFRDYLVATFDRLYREAQRYPRMMTVALHTRTSGLAARSTDIDDFLTYARSRADVWFARRLDIAQHWLATHGSEA